MLVKKLLSGALTVGEAFTPNGSSLGGSKN
jgi:hypothetical protein